MLDQHHSSMRSCFATQIGWLVLRVVYCTFTCFLVQYGTGIFCQNYVIIPQYLKCNILLEEQFPRIFLRHTYYILHHSNDD